MDEIDVDALVRSLRREGIGYSKLNLGPAGQAYTQKMQKRLTPEQYPEGHPGVSQLDYTADLNNLPPSEFMAKWGHLPGKQLK